MVDAPLLGCNDRGLLLFSYLFHMSLFKRAKIEEYTNPRIKGKSWFLRKIWPLIKDEVIDLFFILLQEAKAEMLERLEKELKKKKEITL